MTISKVNDCTKDNVSLHLKNIYNDCEVNKKSTTEEFSTVEKEGERPIVTWRKKMNFDESLLLWNY